MKFRRSAIEDEILPGSEFYKDRSPQRKQGNYSVISNIKSPRRKQGNCSFKYRSPQREQGNYSFKYRNQQRKQGNYSQPLLARRVRLPI